MFRVSLANAFAKRTCTPLYEKHQATPFAGTLAAATVTANAVYSGMVAAQDSTGAFVVADGTSDTLLGVPFGLFALDCNPTINDLDGQSAGTSPFAVWIGGPDALFKVTTLTSDATKGAFENTDTYIVGAPIFCSEAGQITSVDDGGDGLAIGRVIEVVSATTLVVQIQLPALVADVTV